MPNVGMSEEEARQLTDWLLQPGLDHLLLSTTKHRVKSLLPNPNDRNMLILFGVGGAIGVVFATALFGLVRLWTKRHDG